MIRSALLQREKALDTHPAGPTSLAFGKQQGGSLEDGPGRRPVLPVKDNSQTLCKSLRAKQFPIYKPVEKVNWG